MKNRITSKSHLTPKVSNEWWDGLAEIAQENTWREEGFPGFDIVVDYTWITCKRGKDWIKVGLS